MHLVNCFRFLGPREEIALLRGGGSSQPRWLDVATAARAQDVLSWLGSRARLDHGSGTLASDAGGNLEQVG